MSARRSRDIRAFTPWLEPRPPPPLPRLVVPLKDETVFSYLARVAAANHVPEHALWIRINQRPPDTDEDPLVQSRWIAALRGIGQNLRRELLGALQVPSVDGHGSVGGQQQAGAQNRDGRAGSHSPSFRRASSSLVFSW